MHVPFCCCTFVSSLCAFAVEALGGTLKAAKKRKLVGYDSELLLQGVQVAQTHSILTCNCTVVAPPTCCEVLLSNMFNHVQ